MNIVNERKYIFSINIDKNTNKHPQKYIHECSKRTETSILKKYEHDRSASKRTET
jgi:hypothetical protein